MKYIQIFSRMNLGLFLHFVYGSAASLRLLEKLFVDHRRLLLDASPPVSRIYILVGSKSHLQVHAAVAREKLDF